MYKQPDWHARQRGAALYVINGLVLNKLNCFSGSEKGNQKKSEGNKCFNK